MTKYNVIWIDDECEQDQYFVSNAVEKGIKIAGFKFAKEGIEALKANFEKWDAIILDANCLLDNIDKSPDVETLEYSITEIKTHFIIKKDEIPVFILSGYKDFLNNNMAQKFIHKYKVFNKDDESVDGFNGFYDQIIEKIQNSPRTETFVRSKYAEILSIDSNWEKILTQILVAYERNDKNNPSVLNLIRDILEYLNIEFFKIGLSNSIESISNIPLHWDCNEMDFIPLYIRAKIRSLVNTTNAGSHAVNSQTLKDVEDGKAPYLVKSCVLDLLTVLLWYNKELDRTAESVRKYKTIRADINNRKLDKQNPNAIRIKGKISVDGNKYYAEITEGLGLSPLDNGKKFSGKINSRWR